MDKKLLIIGGPTATGKTSLAVRLAKKFKGEIVSADSRQVYQGMDIGTGKDLPENSKFEIRNSKLGAEGIGYYQISGVKVWGLDLVDPKKDFSVAQYVKVANSIIKDILERQKLPILTGGTGLYIKAVVDGIPTTVIPRSRSLRKNLADKTPQELFEYLAQLDPIKAGSLNLSDKKNPRRLVRAVEIATWSLSRGRQLIKESKTSKEKVGLETSTLFIGLTTSDALLKEKIVKRVRQRLKAGIEEEIKTLLAKKVSWKNQSMTSLGYKQWKDYFQGKKSKKEVVKEWENQEYKYAKRQFVWFKKDKRFNWYDVNEGVYPNNVEKLVKKWYDVPDSDAKKN